MWTHNKGKVWTQSSLHQSQLLFLWVLEKNPNLSGATPIDCNPKFHHLLTCYNIPIHFCLWSTLKIQMLSKVSSPISLIKHEYWRFVFSLIAAIYFIKNKKQQFMQNNTVINNIMSIFFVLLTYIHLCKSIPVHMVWESADLQ